MIISVLALHAVLLGWIGYRNSPGFDELPHLAAGLSHWKLGRYELYRVNPPLVRLWASLPVLFLAHDTPWQSFSAAPYGRPEFTVGSDFATANGVRTAWLLTVSRWACIPFSIVGALVCLCWSTRLIGHAAGFMALVFWCFSPTVLANGAMITPDMPAAALGLAACYVFWRWMQQPTTRNTIATGLCLGLAALTKFTLIILFVAWPVLYAISLRGHNGPNRSSTATVFIRTCVIIAISIFVINATYGFDGSFKPLSHFPFISRTLGGQDAHITPGNRFADGILGWVPVPFPEQYVRGIDEQKFEFERKRWSYLQGQQQLGGWWYYYIYAFCVKEPGAIHIGIVCALLLSVRSIVFPSSDLAQFTPNTTGMMSKALGPGYGYVGSATWRDTVFLLAIPLILSVVVSCQTGISRHWRYMLPSMPFLFIWISRLADLKWTPTIYRQRTGRSGDPAIGTWPSSTCRGLARGFCYFRTRIPMLLAVYLVVSSLSTYPHSMSYFNEISGGPMNGSAHLLDSNYDWGQDLFFFKQWQGARNDAHHIRLSYFGFVDPRTLGVSADSFPCLPEDKSNDANVIGEGWYAISANWLHDYKYYGHDTGCSNKPFRRLAPYARAGYSIYVYRVDR